MAYNLTDRQIEAFHKLSEYINNNGRSPNTREMLELFVVNHPRSVTQFLNALEKAGCISRGIGARNIKILTPPPTHHVEHCSTILIPVVGHVSCGIPLFAEQNIIDHMRVSTTLAKPPFSYFILVASGNSMNKAGINNGDYILIRQTQIANDGQTVVALIDNETTVKKMRRSKRSVILEPQSTDPVHKPIVVEQDFKIQGVVVEVV